MSLNSEPIGIFDSGLGGLTLVKAVARDMPNENIVFLGDSLNVPYGDKTPEQITSFACKNADFLMSKGVKAIAVACNTVDSVALEVLKERLSVPVIGVVIPASEKAVKLSVNKKIGILATCAVVKNGAYARSVKEADEKCEVFSVAAPSLVPLIEKGKIHSDDADTVNALKEYLKPFLQNGTDTLILGCTHYPLIVDIVREIMPDVNIVCSGESSLSYLKDTLEERNLINKSEKIGDIRFYVTGNVSCFEKNGGMFLGKNINGSVEKTVI